MVTNTCFYDVPRCSCCNEERDKLEPEKIMKKQQKKPKFILGQWCPTGAPYP